MKRFPGLLTLALLGLGAAAAGLADQPSAAAPLRHPGGGRALAHMERCLSSLDLSADQNTAIQAILTSSKATIQGDAEALRANHAQMEADLANGADKSTLGQNVLNQNAAMAKMKSDSQAVRDQVAAQLTPDQQDKFNACASAKGGWHKGRGVHQGQ